MKNQRNYLVAFQCAIFLSAFTAESKIYEISQRSEGNSNIRLFWDVNYARSRIEFEVEIPGRITDDAISTFGLGMSDRSDVTNADVMMIRYSKDGVEIQDSWTNEDGVIFPDGEQDYHLIEYDVTEVYVSIKFWRHLDTLDDHDYQIDNGTTNLFYLMDNTGENSGSPPEDYSIISTLDELLTEANIPELNAKQMEHAVIPVQLLKPDIPDSYFGNESPEDIHTFDILQNNITLPPQVTTYWCSVHKLPDAVSHKKVHGIGFGVNLSKESLDIVHHMEVFRCDPKDGEVSEYNGPCDSSKEPSDVKRCNRVLGAWAKGASDLFYPKEAGIPFGEVGDSRYLRLEVHYNNPKKLGGIVDSSGMRFFYTNKLRKYDAGILEVGLAYNTNLAIPPGQNEFVLSGNCLGKCTAEGLLPGGINVFASQLHAHLTGRKVWISHERQGQELPELNRDDHYDTNFEEIRQIYPPAKILPGDSMVTSCSYDTSKRRKVTTTGNGLSDEMCISYLHYYPLSPLEVCKSSTSTSALEEFFLIEKLFTGYPKSLNLKDLGENYYSMRWDEDAVNDLKTTYREASQDIECKQHNGNQMPGVWEEQTVV